MTEIAISNSEMAKWLRCPRAWYVAYYLGFVPADEPAVSTRLLGTRVHTALEGYYGYGLDPVAVLDIMYGIEKKAKPDWEEELAGEQDMARAMVEGYLEWVAETAADTDLEVVATEADLIVPLPGLPGVSLRARLDQVYVEKSTGLLGFMDYKTAADFEKHQVLELDPQFRLYCLMQQMMVRDLPGAPRVTGGTITTLRRVKRSGKSKPPYYQRDHFRYNADQLSSTFNKAMRVCEEILDARQQLDEAYARGGRLEEINTLQRSVLRPVPILNDCRWSCPLAKGLCSAMDDGSDWPAALLSSGKYRQDDPYAYYRRDGLNTIRAELAKL